MRILMELTVFDCEELTAEQLQLQSDKDAKFKVYYEVKQSRKINGKKHELTVLTSSKSYIPLEKGKPILAEIKVTNYQGKIYYKILKLAK